MHRILIVDDEPMIRKGFVTLLKQYDDSLDVCTASNGHDALQKMLHYSPGIVLTDIRMPKMDGLELSKAIHETKTNTSIVIISGYDDFQYAKQCISYGVKEYLLKPVTEAELYPVLDKLLQMKTLTAVSLSLYEKWLKEAEEAIWTLDDGQLAELLARWRTTYAKEGVQVSQCQQLVADGLDILQSRLQARGFTAVLPHNVVSALTIREAADYFHKAIREIADQILQFRSGNQKKLFDEAIRYIDLHIKEDVSLECIAEKVGLTPAYFSHYFKKIAKESFVQYRMRKRIELAIGFLEMPQYKVVDAGLEAGFSNYTYFHKVFKKVTGYSPTEYRAMLGIK
ncbi:response regulator [Paenibacillus sp. PAMC21692]|uniref:response regulator transcription factor n=1 Tax=Paenibacillus sp. PAMC21692 TaxID=2762320 RepID=UPI00164E0969|nr:response regulator [Paenibacillus sp. PAMC21692]QNK57170.1 response regulator [Paenibacillus sp. PAMC21692]